MANTLPNAWAIARIICLNAQLHPWLERSPYQPVPAADFLRAREDYVGAVAHYSGGHDCRGAPLRTGLADLGLEAQIALPELSDFSIGRDQA